MKTIKLKKLELINFKGISKRTESFEDGENFVYGANGTGKTSLFDAFTWVLFGRDSVGQADNKANIKTLDKDNKPIMGMDNTVIATFDVNGEELTLQRSYVEVWTKHAGDEAKTYEGQTTKYSWDGNDRVSKTEYNNRVKELIDDGLFKLITDPNYFATLDVKERRKIVLGMAGNITDDEVKFMNPNLANFDATKDVEEQRQVALSSKNKLIKDRDNYPARIDEQMQIITSKQQTVSSLDFSEKESLLQNKKLFEANLASIESQQNDVSKSVESILSKNAERIKLLNKIEEYKRAEHKLKNDSIDLENQSINNAKKELDYKLSEIEHTSTRITNGKNALQAKKDELATLKTQLELLKNEEIPNFETNTTCPTCHKELDATVIEESKIQMAERWVCEQKQKIATATSKCEATYEEGVHYKNTLTKLEEELSNLNSEKEVLELVATKEIKPYIEINFESDPVYQGMLEKLPKTISVEDEIKQQKTNLEEEKAKCKENISSLENQLQEYAKVDILNTDIETAKQRIKKLRGEEKEVDVQIAKQEKVIYLCDLWTKTKTEILNKKVSSNFEMVKFKMFNYTKEGNAVPTCEIVVNGVDYVSLNTASRVNAGLDIINALIKYYDVKAPIFIDGRESVSTIKAPNTQIINLVVKEEN